MDWKIGANSFGRAGASAGTPTNGKSAIDIEQPPSASADNISTPRANVLFFRSTRISPEVPCRRSKRTTAWRLFHQLLL